MDDVQDPRHNRTASENITQGPGLPDEVFRQLISWNLARIRKEIDHVPLTGGEDVTVGLVDQLFRRMEDLSPGVIAQIKKYFRTHPNITCVTNWPRKDISIPFIACVNMGEEEQANEQYIGAGYAGMEMASEDALDPKSIMRNDSGVRENYSSPERCTTHIMISTLDSNFAMYLYHIVKCLLRMHSTGLERKWGIQDMSLSGYDLRWTEEYMPTFCYTKVVVAKYRNDFDFSLSYPAIRAVNLGFKVNWDSTAVPEPETEH